MKVISCMAPLQATVQSEQKEGVQRRFTFQVAVNVYISLFIFSWPTGKKKQKGVQKAVFNFVHCHRLLPVKTQKNEKWRVKVLQAETTRAAERKMWGGDQGVPAH